MVQTLQPAALGLIALWPVLSTITILLRFWSRALMRKFYWDDVLITLAWMLAVGEGICVYKFAFLSYQGYHYYDIPTLSIHEQIRAKQFDLSNQLLYIPIIGLVKASIIVFLWRLDDPRRHIRIALAVFFVFNLALTVSTFFSCMFQCWPVNYYYDQPRMDIIRDGEVIQPGGTCFNQLAFYLTQSSLAVFTDVLILLIPAAMIWNLRMQRRKKVAVWGILSLGWIVTIVGITRIVLYWYRFQPYNIDRSYSLTFTISGCEANLAIMAACGPALKALFTRFVPRMFGSRNVTEPRGNVQYWPQGYEGSPRGERASNLSQRGRSWNSKPSSRPRDMQYGMEILESIEQENDDESQEPIVRNESITTDKSAFDFAFHTEDVVKPQKARPG